MTLNFPSSPSDQDTYSGYVYDAAKGVWKKIASTTDNISEGSTNLYFTDQRALDATDAAYDAAGSAATAESNANSYTDGRESAITTAYESYADTAEADAISTAAADATTKANNAQSAAEATAAAYTDARETAITTAYQTYADQAEADAETAAASYTDTKIAELVDGAPELLNTLDEIAAAIADDENFSTTVVSDIAQGLTDAKDYTDAREIAITTAYQGYADTAEADAIATAAADATTKADAAEADAIASANSYSDGRETAITSAYQTYADTAEADAISTAAADATTKANAAESNANTYTDNAIDALDTDDIEEGGTNLYFTNQRAIDAVGENLALDALSDVDTSAKQDGYVLAYNGTSSEWEASAPTGGTADDNAIFKATLFFGGK